MTQDARGWIHRAADGCDRRDVRCDAARAVGTHRTRRFPPPSAASKRRPSTSGRRQQASCAVCSGAGSRRARRLCFRASMRRTRRSTRTRRVTRYSRRRSARFRKWSRRCSCVMAESGAAREMVASVATNLACNDLCSEEIGRLIERGSQPLRPSEGYRLLPRQQTPVVMNTKGASASGKSTLRPLQKRLAGDIGVELERIRADQPGHLAQATDRLRDARRRLQVRRARSPARSCRSSTRSSIATWRGRPSAATCRTC